MICFEEFKILEAKEVLIEKVKIKTKPGRMSIKYGNGTRIMNE